MTDESQDIVRRFLVASSPLEAYLQEHGSLTALEVQSLTVALRGLQTFLAIWKEKEGLPGDNPFLQVPSDLDKLRIGRNEK